MLEKHTAINKISGRSIALLPWANENNITDLNDRLKIRQDAEYSHEHCNKSQLCFITPINKFFKCPDHFRMTAFSIKFCLCGKIGCEETHQQVGRDVQIPNVSVGKFNLCKNFLHFMDVPISNPLDPTHFVSLSEMRKYIEQKNPSLEMLQSYNPNQKFDFQEKRAVASAHNKSPSYGVLRQLLCYEMLLFSSQNWKQGWANKEAMRESYPTNGKRELPWNEDLEERIFQYRTAIRYGDFVKSHYFRPT